MFFTMDFIYMVADQVKKFHSFESALVSMRIRILAFSRTKIKNFTFLLFLFSNFNLLGFKLMPNKVNKALWCRYHTKYTFEKLGTVIIEIFFLRFHGYPDPEQPCPKYVRRHIGDLARGHSEAGAADCASWGQRRGVHQWSRLHKLLFLL